MNYQQFSSRCVNIARRCRLVRANRILDIGVDLNVLSDSLGAVDLICNSRGRFWRLNFAVIVHGTMRDGDNK